MSETAITSTTYDQIAAEYAARWGASEVLADVAARFAALLRPDARVLDIGCGPGHDTARLRKLGLRACGLDRSRGMLAQARHRTTTPLALADMRDLPVRDGMLDGLWVSASFLHIPKRDGPMVLGALRRALRPGGLLYIAVKEGAGERWIEHGNGLRRFFVFYDVDEFDRLLEAAGFTIREGWLGSDSQGRPERWLNRLALKGRI